MQERRKYPRIIVDRPVTVQLSDHRPVALKMIELSREGMRFLCPIAPEINSEVGLRFSLQSMHIRREFRFMSKVRHLYEVFAKPDTPSDYRYVVGVNFTNIQKNELEIFEVLLQNLIT
jgi:hypothetical protein